MYRMITSSEAITKKRLKQMAYEIGYNDAQEAGSLTIPAHSEEFNRFLRENDLNTDSNSIPYYKSYQKGQADWFHNETTELINSEQ